MVAVDYATGTKLNRDVAAITATPTARAISDRLTTMRNGLTLYVRAIN